MTAARPSSDKVAQTTSGDYISRALVVELLTKTRSDPPDNRSFPRGPLQSHTDICQKQLDRKRFAESGRRDRTMPKRARISDGFIRVMVSRPS